jgi:hypothetical protein
VGFSFLKNPQDAERNSSNDSVRENPLAVPIRVVFDFAGSPKPEAGSPKPEAGSPKPEAEVSLTSTSSLAIVAKP